jgi:hypothetical protein
MFMGSSLSRFLSPIFPPYEKHWDRNDYVTSCSVVAMTTKRVSTRLRSYEVSFLFKITQLCVGAITAHCDAVYVRNSSKAGGAALVSVTVVLQGQIRQSPSCVAFRRSWAQISARDVHRGLPQFLQADTISYLAQILSLHIPSMSTIIVPSKATQR